MTIHSNPTLRERERESKKSRLFRLSLSIFISIFIGLLAGAIYLLAFTGPGSRQPGEGNPDFWIRSGTDVYYTGGNVGIGTTGPAGKLHVAGIGTQDAKIFLTSPAIDSWPEIVFQNDAYTWRMFAPDGSQGDIFTIGSAQSGYNNFVIQSNTGNVGIGTTAPSQKLDVVGYVKGQSGLCIGNDCRSSWPSGQPLSLRQNSCYWTNWGCGQIICPVGYYLVGWDQTSADWCPTSDWEPMRAYCCQP